MGSNAEIQGQMVCDDDDENLSNGTDDMNADNFMQSLADDIKGGPNISRRTTLDLKKTQEGENLNVPNRRSKRQLSKVRENDNDSDNGMLDQFGGDSMDDEAEMD